jgi:pimeloyl-ACP methyl ester carboxylesterase
VATVRVTTADGIGLHVYVDTPDVSHDRSSEDVPALLVHGLASNARLWDGVRRALYESGHTVAAVDLRGHGLSDKPDAGYDFATITADVVSVLDALGWDRAVVAGQSWGGNVVLELAGRHAERCAAIVCVDGGWITLSSLGPWEVVRERLAPPQTEGTPRAAIERYMRQAHPVWTDEAIEGALACFEVRDDGTVAPHLTLERHLTILRHLWEHEPAQLYPRLRTPVVLVPCDDGSPRVESTRTAVAAAEAAIPDVRTVWFRSSHDVHAERPDDIAAIIREEARR